MLLKLKLKLRLNKNPARIHARIQKKALEALGERTVRAICSAHAEKAPGILLARMQDREVRLAAWRRQHPR